MQIRRPSNYDPHSAILLGPTDPSISLDLSRLDLIRTVVQVCNRKNDDSRYEIPLHIVIRDCLWIPVCIEIKDAGVLLEYINRPAIYVTLR